MSATVRSYGFIAVLKVPVDGAERREDLSDRLYDTGSDLDIIAKGSMVYLDYNRHKSYRQREDFYGLQIEGVGEGALDPQDIVREASKYGLEVDDSTIRAFNCIWYNGGDCPVWLLKKDEYLNQIGKVRNEPAKGTA